MTEVIRTDQLSKRYGRVQALQNVSLNVPEGAIVGLIGPNGAGKSTLIRTLLNIVRMASGQAEVLGVTPTRLGPATLARIGYVSENQDLPEWMSVGSLVRYLAPFYPTWDHAAADEMRRAAGLSSDQKVKGLSRGMRMKLALICALVFDPALVVLDEPFSGLDPLIRDELTGQLLERAGERTVLISSHDLAEMETFVTHVAYLDGGIIHFYEETAALLQRFRQVEILLGDDAAAPRNWPEEWLHVESSPSMVRFVHSRYDELGAAQQIHAVLPNAREIGVTPIGLRTIFIALARQSRAVQEVAQ